MALSPEMLAVLQQLGVPDPRRAGTSPLRGDLAVPGYTAASFDEEFLRAQRSFDAQAALMGMLGADNGPGMEYDPDVGWLEELLGGGFSLGDPRMDLLNYYTGLNPRLQREMTGLEDLAARGRATEIGREARRGRAAQENVPPGDERLGLLEYLTRNPGSYGRMTPLEQMALERKVDPLRYQGPSPSPVGFSTSGLPIWGSSEEASRARSPNQRGPSGPAPPSLSRVRPIGRQAPDTTIGKGLPWMMPRGFSNQGNVRRRG